MIKEQFSRTARLYGEDAMEKLSRSSVLLFGVGGVGSYVAESLARAGVGRMCLVDSDEVCESNINRQAMALHSTIGKKKAEVMAERMMDINPDMTVDVKTVFYLPENADDIDFSGFDVIADCIDTVTAKLEIISKAKAMGIGFICMEGNIHFYRHAGFVLASKLNIHYHCEPKDSEAPYFLAQELIKGYLNGIEATYTPPKG